jgi:hypothetical protein
MVHAAFVQAESSMRCAKGAVTQRSYRLEAIKIWIAVTVDGGCVLHQEESKQYFNKR